MEKKGWLKTIELTCEETCELEEVYKSIKESPYENTNEYIQKCRSLSVPKSLEAGVSQFKNDPERLGLLIKNLPIDSKLPKFPSNEVNEKNTFITEASQILIGSLIGEVFSYLSDYDGRIIKNKFPIDPTNTLRNGHSVPLGFHMEKAFHDIQPDYFSLMCLRGDERAKTWFVDSKEVLSKLTPEEKEVLRKPLFLSPSYPNYQPTWEAQPKPILDNRVNISTLCFEAATKSLDEEGRIVLEKVRQICSDVAKHIVLEKGDLIIFKNWLGLHGRSAFTPKFDGNDRWLQLLYFQKDLNQIVRRNGHIITF